jgi:hypothetical protein
MFGRAKKDDATPAEPSPAEEAEAAAAAKSPQYVTRAELNAALGALANATGLALGELADGVHDQFFHSSRYSGHLERTAEAAPPSVKRMLGRLLKGIAGHVRRDYGVDRNASHPRQSWDRI